MTRRWFVTLLGSVAAFLGVARVASASPRMLWHGTVRDKIARREVGWVDLDNDAPAGVARISAVMAKARWTLHPGARVIVRGDITKAAAVGEFPEIVQSDGGKIGELHFDGKVYTAEFGELEG